MSVIDDDQLDGEFFTTIRGKSKEEWNSIFNSIPF